MQLEGYIRRVSHDKRRFEVACVSKGNFPIDLAFDIEAAVELKDKLLQEAKKILKQASAAAKKLKSS